MIRWCKRSAGALFLLSTNDKTIKLWKIYEKKVRQISEMNIEGGRMSHGGLVPSIDELLIPKVTHADPTVAAHPRRTYSNAHAYHINSLSVNSDGQTFLSADDLRINLWSTEITDCSFNIVDIKPSNMEELTEVITSAQFQPTSCSIFIYSSSRGSIKLGDMRASALCDQHVKRTLRHSCSRSPPPPLPCGSVGYAGAKTLWWQTIRGADPGNRSTHI